RCTARTRHRRNPAIQRGPLRNQPVWRAGSQALARRLEAAGERDGGENNGGDDNHLHAPVPFLRISALIGDEDEIAIDDHPHRKAWPDGERRLDVEIALRDLLTGLAEAVTAALPERRRDGRGLRRSKTRRASARRFFGNNALSARRCRSSQITLLPNSAMS